MSKKDKRKPDRKRPVEPRGLDDILAGSRQPSPLSISAFTGTSKPLSPKSGMKELIESMIPTPLEYEAIPGLMTSINQHLDTMTRTIAFAKHTNKGERELPEHLTEFCAAEGNARIPLAAILKAGWPDTEKLLLALSGGVHQLSKEDTTETRRAIGTTIADFFRERHMYESGMSREQLIDMMTEHSQAYIDLVNAALYAKRSSGQRDTALLDGMKKSIFGEAQGTEAVLTTQEAAALEKNKAAVEDWLAVLKVMGEAQISPFQFCNITVKSAIDHERLYMKSIYEARKIYPGNHAQAALLAEEAMTLHKQALDLFIDARKALQPTIDLFKTANIAHQNISIDPHLPDAALAATRTLSTFTKTNDYSEIQRKFEYAAGKLSNAEKEVIRDTAIFFADTIEMFTAENIRLQEFERAADTLKQAGGGTDATSLSVPKDSREYRDALAQLETIVERFRAGRGYIKSISESLNELASSHPSKNMEHMIHHLGKAATLFGSKIDEGLTTLLPVLKTMRESYDDFDITHNECSRLQDNLDKVIDVMKKRQAEWDKQHPGAAREI